MGKHKIRDGRFSLKQFPEDMRFAGLRYIEQLHTAEMRGVQWRFTFDEWWKVWQDSGHWAERGCGAEKYCMCRFGDSGPYAADNVFIATNRENSAAIDRSKQCWDNVGRARRVVGKPLPVGVRSQTQGKYYATKRLKGIQHHIGTFPTPELAHAAYQNFSA